ncbi:MAG: hypothetical protein CL910_01680 [Deltaproteobacteria bacterium]|jgi:hypothetical protein|nr:hypothetical protein [Deltaproteobacteria bacterium]
MAETEASGAGAAFGALLGESPIDMDRCSAFLDGLSHAERVEAIRAVGRRGQAALYEAARGFSPVRLEDLVPAGAGDGKTVRHFGKNTLPAFTHFEKRFCRPAGQDPASPEQLWGFNFQTMQPLTGPGYFIARPSPEAGDTPEVWVDYNQVPPEAAAGWPAVRSNERGLSRFVYGFMIDTLRRVSEHVTIGSAARKGKDLGSWFLLTREP